VEEVFVDSSSDTVKWFRPEGSQGTTCEEGEGVAVRCESVASLIRRLELRRIDVLLIDIEGAEVDVLLALPWEELEFSRIYCELHPGEWHRFGRCGRDLVDLFEKHGLVCIDMYLNPYSPDRNYHYVGPTLITRNSPSEFKATGH
jgi:hypothetical protein